MIVIIQFFSAKQFYGKIIKYLFYYLAINESALKRD